ncbi:MAG: hypothetical protein ACKOEC_00245 [Acidimicrobiia bacterium]
MFTSLSSAHYPDLGAYYEEEADRWLDDYRRHTMRLLTACNV